MRRLLFILTLPITLVAVAAATDATAVSATNPTSLVITVKSITTGTIKKDKAPKGASKGDRFLIRDRLVNVATQFGKPAGAVVGRDEGVLVLTSAHSGTFEGTATLPGGTIRLHGVIRNGIETYSVVGGTGTYAHARGTIAVGSGKSPLNTYHLSLGGMTAITPVI